MAVTTALIMATGSLFMVLSDLSPDVGFDLIAKLAEGRKLDRELDHAKKNPPVFDPAGCFVNFSEIDADGEATAHHVGNLSRICKQLRPSWVVRQALLRLAICFPI
jgi:hypothetical protein